ncbi:helix-hairpin-helix domain-containing protein [Methylobacterium sp. WL9]|uniref:helix-hairpin-helix domain-containing protein n=1 Tax=Methylobacterium sp. WL9 TaxID=2603898 RepID=UPI0011C72CC4|nr:helix-hairpin-helix domain-containing protein [Methylobacterium sp. WL9]TXN23229.1 helix-hairpin-helix domain-containing protein [Methylobacterium sp. WL9]
MKASTLFLGFTLVALAAALAGLWQAFGPRSATTQAAVPPPTVEAPARRPKPMEPTLAEPTEPGVRSVYPGGRPTAAARPQSPESAPPPAMSRQAPVDTAPAPAAPAPERSAALTPPSPDTPAEAPIEAPVAGEGIDLNTAPVEALNALGAGMIGKTIIANRPYAAPEELLTRRVLKRQDYETIKPNVVVR